MDCPATLTPDDNDTYLVTFPDVEGAVTFGDTIEEALARAAILHQGDDRSAG
jgi:predicted RNase H-like HicB family nuclease